MLSQMRAAGCTEWALVTATLLRRVDCLQEIIDGRAEVHDAWVAAVDTSAGHATTWGDHARAQFLTSLRDEMGGASSEVPNP